MGKRKLSIEDKESLVKRYQDGESTGRLCTAFGISQQWVCMILEQAGIPRFDKRRLKESEEDRFWARVEIRGVNECWPWIGSRNPPGYGRFRETDTHHHVMAHRRMYQICFGDLPEGWHVCHDCDHPWCVNPLHLFAGTAQHNMWDRKAKGWFKADREQEE